MHLFAFSQDVVKSLSGQLFGICQMYNIGWTQESTAQMIFAFF